MNSKISFPILTIGIFIRLTEKMLLSVSVTIGLGTGEGKLTNFRFIINIGREIRIRLQADEQCKSV